MVDFIPEDIEWMETEYSLNSLRENDLTLPAIIKITSDDFGISDLETFSSDEVLFLYDWKMEERVMAVSSSITLSIPIDSKYFFKVNNPQSPVMTLAQIVQTYQPPITVRVTDAAGKECPMIVNNEELNLRLITLKSSHYLEYVLANKTVAGQVCMFKLICLPIYHTIRFVIARKLSGVPIENLGEHINGFLFLSRNIKSDNEAENPPDIVEHKFGVMHYDKLFDINDDSHYTRPVPMGSWIARTIKNPGQVPRSVLNPNPRLRMVMQERQNQRSLCGNLPETDYNDRIADGASNYDAIDDGASNYHAIADGASKYFDMTANSTSSYVELTAHNFDQAIPYPHLTRDLEQVHINTDYMFMNSQPISNSPVAMASKNTPCLPKHPIHDKADIPTDIADLSVSQLCDCLSHLNMPEFIPKFMYAQMNGMLLCKSSVEDLVAEFGMGTLKAKKLRMFANDGWRPC